MAELMQYEVTTVESIADGHGMVAARAVPVERLRIVDGMEMNVQVRVRRSRTRSCSRPTRGWRR